MSAEIIVLADRRRARSDRALAAHQAALLLAPYRASAVSVAAIVTIAGAACIAWCAVFFPLLWMAP